MKISELFVLNPAENNLLNDGVVNINTAADENGLKTIRHELRTFVCEGEYERGIERILSTYLRYLDQPKQPAVWVSGFFGSGKSHLIKMLKYYWEDYRFPTGESARTIKELPFSVKEKLVELDRKQKLYGKLAVSGTFKDFPSNDIRYSFLQLLLNALRLPSQYHHFKFVYWAQKEGILNDLKAILESQGRQFEKELENLFVSTPLTRAVLELKPEFAENEAKAREAFRVQFQRVDRLDRHQLISTIKEEVLPMFFGDKIPCTVIVLDEVQQFIGQDASKTIDIQNLAQDICENFNGKFLLIGTGQNALADTPQLSPLKDRFSVTVALTDTDVETVTRKTVLEKKASVVPTLESRLEQSLGEISRNLSGTGFGYTTADRNTLVADYPILPSIRKFWKKILDVIDKAGTSGQLRSQLRIVDESLKHIAGRETGAVVPGDFIFEQKKQQLLQNAILLNETNNMISARKAQGGDSLLEGRIISAVFLLDQLPKDLPGGGLTSNADTIADLLLEELDSSSDAFRGKVKKTIEKLAQEKVLMPVGPEYKLQTKTGAEWEQEFTSQVIRLNNDGEDIINRFRREAFMEFLKSRTRGINVLQGISKQQRDFDLWDRDVRPDTSGKLHVWIRDGWNESETLVLEEIRAEGADSPLAYLFIPRERDQELRSEIIKHLAAKATLANKGIPSSLEGEQAMKGMETRQAMALKSISDLAETIVREARVYLAGGAAVDSGNLTDNLREALIGLADRQFPEFKGKADVAGWDRALNQAIAKNPDALRRIQYNGEAKDHPVAIDILRFMGHSPKTGRDIRTQFLKAPYGWSQDAIDTMLCMLTVTEILSSSEQDLKTGTINGAVFKKEVHTLGAADKLRIRKLFQEANLPCKPGEEFPTSNLYLSKLSDLAGRVSGDGPLPAAIDTGFIAEILKLDGNERLLRTAQEDEDLRTKYTAWTAQASTADQRRPKWTLITALYDFLPNGGEQLKEECDAIRSNRLLLHEPDPVAPLLQRIVDTLNTALIALQQEFIDKYDRQVAILQADEYFARLSPEEKHGILARHQLLHKHEAKRLEAPALLNHLQKISLESWRTRISALDSQFAEATEEAVKLAAPKTVLYNLPRRTLQSEAELAEYLNEIKAGLTELIRQSGSVILK